MAATARLAVVVPGRAYGPEAPLLAFAIRALTEHGYDVSPVRWSGEMVGDPEGWVRREVEAALDGAAPAIVVGKSRGTWAAGWAAELEIPAAWLTPLLREPVVVAGLRDNPAPQLLVGGAADDLWDAVVADALREDGCLVHTVPDADHALADPASAVRSAEMQLDVARAVDGFLRSLS